MVNEAILTHQPCLSLKPRVGETDRELSWRQEILKAGPKALLIVPTSRRRRLEMVHQAMEGVFIQPRRCTLLGLTQELAGFCQEQWPLMGNVEQALRMARCLTDGQYPASSGMVRHLLHERRMLQSHPDTARHPFAAILEAYERGLQEDQVWDQTLQEKHLAQELRDDRSPVAKHLRESHAIALLDGFHSLSPGEVEVLRGIGQHIPLRLWFHGTHNAEWQKETNDCLDRLEVEKNHRTDCFVNHAVKSSSTESGCGEGDGPRVEWIEVGQKRDIFRRATEIVRTRLERPSAVDPGDIAIVVNGPTEARQCRQALERMGIPCCAPAERIALVESRPARFLLDALALRLGRISHEELSTFLLSPLAQKDLDHTYLLGKLLRFSQGVRGLRRPDEWAAIWETGIANRLAHARHQEDPEDRETTDQKYRELAESALKLLTSATTCIAPRDDANNPGEVLANQLTAYLNQLELNTFLGGKARPSSLPCRDLQEDQLAWNNLKDALEELRSIPPHRFPVITDGRGKNRPDWTGAVRLALESESFALGSVDEGQVQIIRPRTLRGASFDTVLWVGLNQNEYPTRPQSIASPSPQQESDLREQEYLFYQAFRSARQQVHFLRAKKDGDEDLLAGPFWKKGGPASPPPDTNNQTARPLPWFVANPRSKPLDAELSFWLNNSANSNPTLDPWAIPIMNARWTESQAFSPTSLELFNRCAFRFFAEKTLRLLTPSESRLALAWGTLVHEALEKATEKDKQLPHDEQRLRGGLEQALARHQIHLDPFHTHQIQRMVALLCQGKWKEKMQGFIQVEAEHTFENFELGTDPGGRKVLLSGRIDLIASNAEANCVAILDFKTGKIVNIQKKIDSRRLLQPGLYAFYYRGRREAEAKTITAGYVFVDKRDARLTGAKNFPGQNRGGFTLNMTVDKQGLAIPQKAGIDSAHAIREGTISLTVHGPNQPDSECTAYCSARHACRHATPYKSR